MEVTWEAELSVGDIDVWLNLNVVWFAYRQYVVNPWVSEAHTMWAGPPPECINDPT